MNDGTLCPVSGTGRRRHRLRHLSAEYEHETNILCLAGVRENQRLSLHELMHFFEHCSTPYGVFRDERHSLEQGCIERFLRDYEGPVFTPVYDWVKGFLEAPNDSADSSHLAGFGKLIEETIKPWSRYKHFSDVLEGEDTQSVIEADYARLNRILGEIEAACRPLSSSKLSSQICPSLVCEGTHGREIPVGALHVSECIAQIQEGLVDCTPDSVSPEYYALSLLGTDYLHQTEMSMPSRSDRDLGMTLLALADLALFTPVGSFYGRYRNPNVEWRSIHPGARFWDALDLVARNDWWVASLFEAEELGNRVCKTLDWPSPRRLLEAMVKSNDMPQLSRHQAACKIRIDDFMAFYRPERILEPASPVKQFLEEYMPTIYFPGIGTVCNVPGTDNMVAIRQLRDCYVTRRCIQIMQKPASASILPPECHLDWYADNISTEFEFAELIFQNRPWLDSRRFLHLKTRT